MQQHGASNEAIQCAQCDATFLLRTAYDRHCREQHDVDTVLTECGECGQKCCNRQALDKHMLRHTGKKSYVYHNFFIHCISRKSLCLLYN